MILDKIVERKKEEVAFLRKHGIALPDQYKERVITPPRGFRQALIDYQGVAIIAEAKKASPSKGILSPDFNLEKIVHNYEKCGAQALSVLTDVDFFQGSLEYMLRAREQVALPVLRKDFIIDELQIGQSSLHGADAILLIVAILDDHQLSDYFAYARELQMDVLVEVHDENEMERALRSGCDLIGVNNRNLNDFSVDINTTFRLMKMMPDSMPLVSESGLKGKEDIDRLLEHGVAAALIGESLMKAGTESSLLSELRP